MGNGKMAEAEIDVTQTCAGGERGLRSNPWYMDALCALSLCAQLLSSLYPRLEAVNNIAAGLGIVTLIWFALSGRIPPIPKRWKIALGFFTLAALASCVIPDYSDGKIVSDNFHRIWNTCMAMGSAFLAMLWLRERPQRMLGVISIFSLALAVVCLYPYMILLFGNIDLPSRMSGTKGGVNRFAVLLIPGCVSTLLLFNIKRLYEAAMPVWSKWAGYVLALAGPYLIIRKLQVKAFDDKGTIYFIIFGIIAGILMWSALVKPGLPRRIIAFLFSALIVHNCLLCNSRASTIAILLLLALTFGYVIFRNARSVKWIAASLIIIAAIAGIGLMHNDRMKASFIQKALQVRIYIWQASYGMFTSHPVFGIGPGYKSFSSKFPQDTEEKIVRYNLETEDPKVIAKEMKSYEVMHAHNILLQPLASQGVVGLAAFILLYACTFLTLGINRENNDPSARIASWMGRATLFVLLVQGTLMNPLQQCNEVYFWFIIACCLALTYPRIRSAQPDVQAA
ncbi:MAG: O-antigen ligase family protein [Planctomycetes bacterium]|nr:O-antigen ligase family protein [Planctomycetota bacterium]